MSGVVRELHETKGVDVPPLHSLDESWERFLSAEHRSLLARQRGQFRLALGTPLPGEFEEEIEWMAREDQRRAGEGLVDLKGKQGVYYKHLEDLAPGDMAGRMTAEKERCNWLMSRMEERMRLIREAL